LLIHSFAYENISHKNEYFEQLKVAIIENRNIDFTYTKGAEGKNYKKIQPYKLVNNKGIWYLAAVDHDKLKTFSFSKISHLSVDFDSSFTPSKAILGDIGLNRNIWFSSEQETVQLKVDSSVADYFKRRELINDQKIDSECENGDLLISLSISHPNQIIPIVRYWMPNIQIISPAYLNDEISESINEFKKRSINTSTP
jgi:predicted DNA-binding transcriptional regulator YafY